MVINNHKGNKTDDEPKTYETTDQDTIRKETKSFYQKNYNKDNSINPTKEAIREFLDMDDDTAPWEALNKKRIPKEMAKSMEGDLTHEELEEALFFTYEWSLKSRNRWIYSKLFKKILAHPQICN